MASKSLAPTRISASGAKRSSSPTERATSNEDTTELATTRRRLTKKTKRRRSLDLIETCELQEKIGASALDHEFAGSLSDFDATCGRPERNEAASIDPDQSGELVQPSEEEGSDQEGPHELLAGLDQDDLDPVPPVLPRRSGRLNYCDNCNCDSCCKKRSDRCQPGAAENQLKPKRAMQQSDDNLYIAGERLNIDYDRELRDIIYCRYRKNGDGEVMLQCKVVFKKTEEEAKELKIMVNLATLKKCHRYKKVMRKFLASLGEKALGTICQRYPELERLRSPSVIES